MVPSVLFDLMLAEWHLPAPNLVVSLVGEEQPFALKPWLRDVLRKGLVKAAQSTGGSGSRRVRIPERPHAGPQLPSPRSPSLRSAAGWWELLWGTRPRG